MKKTLLCLALALSCTPVHSENTQSWQLDRMIINTPTDYATDTAEAGATTLGNLVLEDSRVSFEFRVCTPTQCTKSLTLFDDTPILHVDPFTIEFGGGVTAQILNPEPLIFSIHIPFVGTQTFIFKARS